MSCRINTPEGCLCVARRIGASYEFYEAGGKWWTLNPQAGFVEVPPTSRALTRAIEELNGCVSEVV